MGERLDRTQEVAGSSPASSISKKPAKWGFCFPQRAANERELPWWSSFGQARRLVLVEMTIFGVPWAKLELSHVEAFLGGAGREPLTWEAKGTTVRPEQVTKHVGGFANAAEDGYLLLGFEHDGSSWEATGCAFPGDDPPVWVSNVVRSTLRPRPRIDVRDWPGKTKKKRCAVVRVEPVAEPPCVTTGGQLYERVSGQTIPVGDAGDVRALYERGAAAVARAEKTALRALDVIGVNDLPGIPCALLLALTIAPVGYADDIAARLFTSDLERSLRSLLGELPTEPLFFEDFSRPNVIVYTTLRQDAVLGATPEDACYQSWNIRAAWDGSVTVLLQALPPRQEQLVPAEAMFTDAVRPMADAIVDVARAIGGYGRAHVALGASARQFSIYHEGHHAKQIPGPGTLRADSAMDGRDHDRR
jgi:hypothetical protein